MNDIINDTYVINFTEKMRNLLLSKKISNNDITDFVDELLCNDVNVKHLVPSFFWDNKEYNNEEQIVWNEYMNEVSKMIEFPQITCDNSIIEKIENNITKGNKMTIDDILNELCDKLGDIDTAIEMIGDLKVSDKEYKKLMKEVDGVIVGDDQ